MFLPLIFRFLSELKENTGEFWGLVKNQMLLLLLSRFSRVDSVRPLETINIFQEIKEKIEKKIAEKMGEFCQIIEMHQKKKKNKKKESTVKMQSL